MTEQPEAVKTPDPLPEPVEVPDPEPDEVPEPDPAGHAQDDEATEEVES